jgi:hypothetical protein
MALVRVPCACLDGVPFWFQISPPTIVAHDPVAVQDTELLFVIAAGLPAVNVENAVAPIETPPAVYPGQFTEVACVPFDPFTLPFPAPVAVISRNFSGPVGAVGADPPEYSMLMNEAVYPVSVI